MEGKHKTIKQMGDLLTSGDNTKLGTNPQTENFSKEFEINGFNEFSVMLWPICPPVFHCFSLAPYIPPWLVTPQTQIHFWILAEFWDLKNWYILGFRNSLPLLRSSQDVCETYPVLTSASVRLSVSSVFGEKVTASATTYLTVEISSFPSFIHPWVAPASYLFVFQLLSSIANEPGCTAGKASGLRHSLG